MASKGKVDNTRGIGCLIVLVLFFLSVEATLSNQKQENHELKASKFQVIQGFTVKLAKRKKDSLVRKLSVDK